MVDSYVRVLKRFFFLLIPYSLLRIGFYLYHLDIYKQFTQDEIFQSFILGIRFDIAAICLLNIPILFLALIPSKNSRFLFFERCLFVVLNSAGILASLDDYELFLFMGKRLSFDLFVITDDIWDQVPQLILYYWYFPVIAFVLGVGLYLFDKRFFRLSKRKSGGASRIFFGILLLGLSFIGIRGGLQHKSINVQSAFTQGRNELGHLVLNTPYHFLRTLKNKSVEKAKYFAKDDEAKTVILNRRDTRGGIAGKKNANVVLIILESFSMEYMEQGYAPFLTELSQKSLFFKKHLANGRRSIEALPSLLCGLPALLDEPISKSIFSGNKFSCMPKILKEAGYTNFFFHGGSRGTMGFESYTLSNGFDRYFSREDYPDKNDYDGTWGIFDGPYLQYVADKLDETQGPFMAGIFTLSSHQPYAVPENMKGKFPKGTLEIHESIGYTDFALKEFFKKIETKPWFKDTVFLITSDHTQKLETKKYQNLLGHYRVPFLIYAPSWDWGEVNTNKVTQHSDIPKTMLDLVDLEGEINAIGASVFSQDAGLAINYADGSQYFLIQGNEGILLNKSQQQKPFRYEWDAGQIILGMGAEDPLLKAYLQYFFNGLINNNLSL